jgi:hypothetical protein
LIHRMEFRYVTYVTKRSNLCLPISIFSGSQVKSLVATRPNLAVPPPSSARYACTMSGRQSSACSQLLKTGANTH